MKKHIHYTFGLIILFFPVYALADLHTVGVLNDVLTQFKSSIDTWGGKMVSFAETLFLSLAVINLVWSVGQLALRQADFGEIMSELIRWIIFTGFFYWLLTNSPDFSQRIINSMTQMGGNLSSLGNQNSPSDIVDVGFDLVDRALEPLLTGDWSWNDLPIIFMVITISVIVVVVLGLIAVNMILTILSAWIVAYGGIFVLGFGGCRWTSDSAVAYYKQVLNIALQLMTMLLLVGIGKDIVINAASAAKDSEALFFDMVVILLMAVCLLALVHKVPPLIGGLVGGIGNGGIGTYGGGAALATGALAMGSIAGAAAAIKGGVIGSAGIASAVSEAGSSSRESRPTDGKPIASDPSNNSPSQSNRSVFAENNSVGGGSTSAFNGSSAVNSGSASSSFNQGSTSSSSAQSSEQKSQEQKHDDFSSSSFTPEHGTEDSTSSSSTITDTLQESGEQVKDRGRISELASSTKNLVVDKWKKSVASSRGGRLAENIRNSRNKNQ